MNQCSSTSGSRRQRLPKLFCRHSILLLQNSAGLARKRDGKGSLESFQPSRKSTQQHKQHSAISTHTRLPLAMSWPRFKSFLTRNLRPLYLTQHQVIIPDERFAWAQLILRAIVYSFFIGTAPACVDTSSFICLSLLFVLG